MTKICSKCGKRKNISNFGKLSKSKDGYRSDCKECRKKESKKRYSENKEYFENYREEHKEHYKEIKKEHYEKNKEHYKKLNSDRYYKNKKSHLEKMTKYRKNNKEELNKYYRERKEKDISYDIEVRVRNRINAAIKNKSNSTKELLGCDVEFYKQYLEEKFEEGMSWENRSEWHIDHIKPLAKFDLTNEKQLFEAFHYTNTQPLWAKDNLSKGCR